MPGFDISSLIPDISRIASKAASTAVKTTKDAKKSAEANQLTTPQKLSFMQALGNTSAQRELTPVAPAKTAAWLVEHEKNTEPDPDDRQSYYGDYIYNRGGYTNQELADLEPKVFTEQRDDLTKQQHQAALQDWKDERDQKIDEYNESPWRTIRGLNMGRAAGNFGVDLTMDQDDLDYKTDDSGWNREYGEFERRLANRDIGNLLSPTSMMLTPDPVRDIYEDYFSDLDSSGTRDEDALSAGWDNENIRKDLIDDGYSPISRESQYMTGEQYLRYLDLGLPGRDRLDIDPDRIYNKQDEAEVYGFVPYITSDHQLREYRTGANTAFVSNVFDNFANSRKIISDASNGAGPFGYSIETPAGDIIDGWALEKRQIPWLKTRPEVDWDSLTLEPSENSSAVSLYVKMDESSDPVAVADIRDDTAYLVNGERVPNISEYDYVWPDIRLNKTDPVYAYTESVPDVVLEDGTHIKPDDFYSLLEDMENGEANVNTGFAGLGTPDSDVEHFWKNPVPAIWDMMTMSMPYFHPVTSALNGFGGVMQNGQGISTQRDMNGAYTMIAENPTNSQLYGATAGSAMMPFTEMLWGPLGRSFSKMSPTRALVQKGGNKVGRMLGRGDEIIPDELATRKKMSYLFGLSDEGLEEIPGNIAEHIQSDGFKDWYADIDYDQPYDKMGVPQYKDTPWWKRFGKFWADAPKSYAAGAVLGSILGPMNSNYYDKIRAEYELNQLLKGNRMEQPEGVLNPKVVKSKEELDQIPADLMDYIRLIKRQDAEEEHHDLWPETNLFPESMYRSSTPLLGYNIMNQLEDDK